MKAWTYNWGTGLPALSSNRLSTFISRKFIRQKNLEKIKLSKPLPKILPHLSDLGVTGNVQSREFWRIASGFLFFTFNAVQF